MRITLLCLFVLTSLTGWTQSVLRAGHWYQVAVQKPGVYKLTYDDFKKMGFDADRLDPRTIRVHGNAGGMLPQPLATSRANDLTENAIVVIGEDDGAFNNGDYVLWYAEGPDLIRFDAQRKIMRYESNLYSEKNFYFITAGNGTGKRINTAASLSGSYPVINSFEDYAYHEVDDYNVVSSGREWYGDRFDQAQKNFSVDMPGIVEGSSLKFVSDVISQSSKPGIFTITINGANAGTQNISAIPQSSLPQYDAKGIHRRDTFSVAATTSAKQDIVYQYNKVGTGYLDFFLLQAKRKLALYGDQTIFRSSESLANANTIFVVEDAAGNTIWDISNVYEPKNQAFTTQGNQGSFAVSTTSLSEFIVFNNSVPAPELIGEVSNQNIHGTATPNLIVVTHPDFLPEAQRLAAHREKHSGWTTLVVANQQVYHEFASGRQDVTAIRDMAKFFYDKNSSTLKALLLFGKSSYDYKDRIFNNTNFVLTYESRNSLNPLQTYSSDDYFGFLENTEGLWREDFVPDKEHTLEIGIGRLPVKTLDEATAVVDKIIDYETNKKSLGSWRKNFVYLADDGNTTDGFTSEYQKDANTLATTTEAADGGFVTKKLFMGTYAKTVKPSGESIPEVTTDILNNFDRGALVLNYTGHGNEHVLSDEQVFTNFDIDKLENKRYPFLVTATCEFGRNDDPAQISGAEQILLRAKSGAIGLITTARPVYSPSNFQLNKAFSQALFTLEDNHYRTIGEVFRQTKNNSISGVNNRNFSLLGDPSMMLALPEKQVRITSLQTDTGSDTLRALSHVTIQGKIEDADGTLQSNFNGTLEATLFDKQDDFTTVGRNNPAYTFKQWSNILFRGQATVRNGTFEMDFIMPRNMAYEIAPGRLSLYASDKNLFTDAGGAETDFKIGGSEKNPPQDNTPPAITLFLGDTTFVSGGSVSPNTVLLARLKDASGISISNYGIGNNLMAVLDNDAKTYAVSDYYLADPNDYTKGWVLDFPLRDLTPGSHTLTLKAWDTHNNPAQATIQFYVTDGVNIVLEEFGNYPNPFETHTTIFFTHNRSGDDLQASLIVYTSHGELLQEHTFTISESEYRVDLLEINSDTNPGKKLPPGLYLARIAVRSLTNGSKNERIAKFIVVH